jgi:hypothetical protein
VSSTSKVALSLTARLLSVVPNCGQSLRLASVQAVSVVFIQIRSTVALALAAPANPTRVTALAIATAKNFRIVLFRRCLKALRS